MSIALTVRELRQQQGFSGTKLAAGAGITLEALRNVESGNKAWPRTIERIARALGLTPMQLYERAAAAGMLVGAPATIVAAFGPAPADPAQIGSINLAIWACIAPTQAAAAWIGAQLAHHASADALSRLFAASLAATGIVMLRTSFVGP